MKTIEERDERDEVGGRRRRGGLKHKEFVVGKTLETGTATKHDTST